MLARARALKAVQIKTLCKQLMCSLRSTVYEMPHELIRVCGTLMYHSKQKFCHDEYDPCLPLLSSFSFYIASPRTRR